MGDSYKQDTRLTNGLLPPIVEGMIMLLVSAGLIFAVHVLNNQLQTTQKFTPAKQQITIPSKYVAVDMQLPNSRKKPFTHIKVTKTKLTAIKRPSQASKKIIQNPNKTANIASRVIRAIIIDEVNTFVRRARLIADASKDLSQ